MPKIFFEFVAEESYEQVTNDKMKMYAIIRAFEIIGEATKLVSEETRINYPLIEWRMMGDFRNILTHNYSGIEYEIVWKPIKESLFPIIMKRSKKSVLNYNNYQRAAEFM